VSIVANFRIYSIPIYSTSSAAVVPTTGEGIRAIARGSFTVPGLASILRFSTDARLSSSPADNELRSSAGGDGE
jgi:hypothetical protein